MKKAAMILLAFLVLSFSRCRSDSSYQSRAKEVAAMAQRTMRSSPDVISVKIAISSDIEDMNLSEIGILLREIPFDARMYVKDTVPDIRLEVVRIATKRAESILIKKFSRGRFEGKTLRTIEQVFAPHPFLLLLIARDVAKESRRAEIVGHIAESDNLYLLAEECVRIYNRINTWKLASVAQTPEYNGSFFTLLRE